MLGTTGTHCRIPPDVLAPGALFVRRAEPETEEPPESSESQAALIPDGPKLPHPPRLVS
jgi:hypothetical protein